MPLHRRRSGLAHLLPRPARRTGAPRVPLARPLRLVPEIALLSSDGKWQSPQARERSPDRACMGRPGRRAVCEASCEPALWLARAWSGCGKIPGIRRGFRCHRRRQEKIPEGSSFWLDWRVVARVNPTQRFLRTQV